MKQVLFDIVMKSCFIKHDVPQRRKDRNSSMEMHHKSYSSPGPDLPIGYVGLSQGLKIQGGLQQTVARIQSMAVI